ncbi:hypothetical protein PVBG_05913 [Plasmodium vivax Brazil I]|uniref:Variable surface protein Vir4 n=1 Tax=Plasmodium vivax (strain Brazil I) TaxID=1033975 RepID=A0A0J9T451_PLAV1|nr:hypothetical protein PVBG_05913 [Plasmodium vivax Brazil I]
MFYKKLDYLSGFNEYFDQCKSLSNLPNRQEVKIICARLLKYLENYKFSKKKDNEYDICILLNYWVYNKLNGILQSSNDSYIYRAFGDIERIWSSFIDDNLNETEYKTCKAISNTVIHYDWRERKELYDYCVNYDALKKILQSYETKCQEYWTYVENHTSIYEHFEKNCSNPQYDCPGFYEGCKKYKPKHVLSEFKCNTEMMDKKVKETTAKARPSLQADIPAVQEPNSRMPTSPEFSSGDSHLTREGTHPATKTGDILLGVVATSLTSGALYRVSIKYLIHIYLIILYNIFLYYIAINNKQICNKYFILLFI